MAYFENDSTPGQAVSDALHAEGVALAQEFTVAQGLTAALGTPVTMHSGSQVESDILAATANDVPGSTQFQSDAIKAGASWAATESPSNALNLTYSEYSEYNYQLWKNGISIGNVDWANVKPSDFSVTNNPDGSWSFMAQDIPMLNGADPVSVSGAFSYSSPEGQPGQGLFTGTVSDDTTGVTESNSASISSASGMNEVAATVDVPANQDSATTLELTQADGSEQTFDLAKDPSSNLPSLVEDAASESTTSEVLAPLEALDVTEGPAPIDLSFPGSTAFNIGRYAAGALKGVGIAGVILDVATTYSQAVNDVENGQYGAAGQTLTGLVARLEVGAAGAEAGAAIGSALGPVGTVVGGLIGGVAGAYLGNDAVNTLWTGATSAIDYLETTFGLSGSSTTSEVSSLPLSLLPSATPDEIAGLVDQAMIDAYLETNGSTGENLGGYAQQLSNEVAENQAAGFISGSEGMVYAQTNNDGSTTVSLVSADGTEQFQSSESNTGITTILDYADGLSSLQMRGELLKPLTYPVWLR